MSEDMYEYYLSSYIYGNKVTGTIDEIFEIDGMKILIDKGLKKRYVGYTSEGKLVPVGVELVRNDWIFFMNGMIHFIWISMGRVMVHWKHGKFAIILDSFTSPLKLQFGTAVQNFGGRADAGEWFVSTPYIIFMLKQIIHINYRLIYSVHPLHSNQYIHYRLI